MLVCLHLITVHVTIIYYVAASIEIVAMYKLSLSLHSNELTTTIGQLLRGHFRWSLEFNNSLALLFKLIAYWLKARV